MNISHRIFVFMCLLLVAHLPIQAVGAEDLTARMQAQYESLTGFRAEFLQELTNAATGQVELRRGEIAYRQPGLIRWETVEPEKELLVVGKEAVWDYFADDGVALRYPREQVLSSKTMLRFISGQANLQEDFVVERQGEENGFAKLKLTPREPEAGMVLAYVWIDRETALLGSVLIVDFYGNGNQLHLKDVVVNPDLPDTLFRFTPPPGVEIQDNSLGAIPQGGS